MPFEVAPNYTARLVLQDQAIEQLKQNPRECEWGYPLGDYSTPENLPVAIHHPRNFVNSSGARHYLSGFEFFMYQSLRRLMEVKKETVIALDLGGGAGLSSSRLSQVFAEEIEGSRLVIVVSNLVLTPKQVLEQRDYPEDNFLTKSEGLIQSVRSTFEDLATESLKLPDGTNLPLLGNVDFGVERRAATAWSKVPEKEIADLAPIFSPFGTYMVNKKDLDTLYGVDDPTQGRDRRHGISLAHANLEKLGFKKVLKVEAGRMKGREINYAVFRNPQAPLFEVN